MSALSYDDVAQYLGFEDTNDAATFDKLSGIVDAAEAMISEIVGPLEPQDPVTQRFAGNVDAFVLPGPVASVSAVSGMTDLSSLVLDQSTGLLRLKGDNAAYMAFTSPFYDITYVPGRADLPADLEFAVKELARHLWTLSNGGSTYAGGPTPDFGMPKSIEVLLRPHRVRPYFGLV